MKKVVISIKEFVADLRARIGDAALRQKYNLSPRTLIDLKKDLLGRGIITPDDIKPSREPVNPNRKTLNAKRFAEDFRERPDDIFLMEKYSLSASQLRLVYRRLIERGVLAEYEYHMRERVAPELNDSSVIPLPSSTVVSLVEDGRKLVPGSPAKVPGHDLPTDFFRDFSGVKIGRSQQNGDQTELQQNGNSPGEQSTVVQLVTCELCPKCLRPIEDPSLESCMYCGIVFSKAKPRQGRGPISVWKKDFPKD